MKVIKVALLVGCLIPATIYNTGTHAKDLKIASVASYNNTLEIILPHIAPTIQVAGKMMPKDCPVLNSPLLVNTGRVGVELSIICNALFMSGLVERIDFHESGNNARLINNVSHSINDILGGSIFPEGLTNVLGAAKPLVTLPVLKIGQFEKKICTTPNRKDVLKIKTLADLRRFSGIVVKSWKVDRKTIYDMKLRSVIEVSSPKTITAMLERKRADFMMVSEGQLDTMGWAKDMNCIQGIKVGLFSQRILLISPQKPEYQKAINDYLVKINSDDPRTLTNTFERSGFISHKMKNWEIIYPVN